MAADHHHHHHLEQLFPRCRLRTSPPVDTAVLIDLSDDSHPPPMPPPNKMTTARLDSDSDASPARRPPSLTLPHHQRRFGPSEMRRSSGNSKIRRSRTLLDTSNSTWTGLFDAYGTGGYEPSSDSEENDSDCQSSMSKSANTSSKRIIATVGGSGGGCGVRSSASESHIVNHQQHWKKTGEPSCTASRNRGVKEIYDLTPTRLDVGSADALVAGCEVATSRLEIAGGREVVSLSRTRTRASQRKRHSANASASNFQHNNNNNNSNTNSNTSAASSVSRYSGEVYYEESVGRYGFHVGRGNTLWGSQGLEPSFSIASCLNEKQPTNNGSGSSNGSGTSSNSHHGLKRPLSWAGDDGPDLDQQTQPEGQSTISSEENKSQQVACSNGQSSGMEESNVVLSSNSKTGVRGYLADFYPEVVLAEHQDQSAGSDLAGSGQQHQQQQQLLLQFQYQQQQQEEPCSLNLDNYLSEQLNQFAQQSSSSANRKEPEESAATATSPAAAAAAAAAGTVHQPSKQQLSVATVIGGLTIAQYEGSPRRYGVRPHFPNSTSDPDENCVKPTIANGPGRSAAVVPGFPRRVQSNPAQQIGSQATFSPSATRQTLVDLAGSPIDRPVANSKPQQYGNNLPWHLEPEETTPSCRMDDMPVLEPAEPLMDETDLGETEVGLEVGGRSRNFTLSPETTDYDDSELDVNISSSHHPDPTSVSACMSGSDNSCSEPGGGGGGGGTGGGGGGSGEIGGGRRGSHGKSCSQNGAIKGQFSSMPVLEDGLSSGQSTGGSEDSSSDGASGGNGSSASETEEEDPAMHDRVPLMSARNGPPGNPQRPVVGHSKQQHLWVKKLAIHSDCANVAEHQHNVRQQPEGIATSLRGGVRDVATPPPPAPLAHRPLAVNSANNKPTTGQQQPRRLLSPGPETPSGTPVGDKSTTMSQQQSFKPGSSPSGTGGATATEDLNLRELDEALLDQHHHQQQHGMCAMGPGRARKAGSLPPMNTTPVWVPRQNSNEYWVKTSPTSTTLEGGSGGPDKVSGADDDEERETDQLLRDPDDQGFFDAPVASCAPSTATPPTASTTSSTHSSPHQQQQQQQHQQLGVINGGSATGTRQSSEPKDLKYRESAPTATTTTSTTATTTAPSVKTKDDNSSQSKKKGRSKEVMVHEPAVLIEGVLFRANYLGSTQIVCEGQPTKYTRMMQAEEAVSRIKALAPEGETQPTTEVDLFISTEKIMVLNTELKEIMMDHALRTISYIADIGDLVVLMARRRMITQDGEDPSNKIAKTPKMVCHVFESEEAQFIAQSIGQAFQVAYMEFLKANGIEDQSFVREMDYQEVLNSQEIFGDELQMFAKKELQKEVIVPKARNEILGVVIVESGWGSMLPTVVIANLAPAGAAARCGQLNIGDQIIAINGISLVGLPLSTCQTYIKNAKSATVVKLTVVPCPPVVEVKIKRPDTKYQLGFSVQNGVICSLLRGGIAERGGVRVGHRIIEINGQSVVAVPHERIVGLLATSVGEINMKTMPTSMFRLLIGQETPVYI